MPYAALWTAGLVNPFIRELRATRYQFVRPFVLDSTLARTTFGLEPTAIDEALRSALAGLRAETTASR